MTIFRDALMLLLGGVMFASCGTPDGNMPVCEERSLPEKTSEDFFIGTWEGCPGTANYDLEHIPAPVEVYCTFVDDGRVEFREVMSSGQIRVRGEGTWEGDLSKGILDVIPHKTSEVERYYVNHVEGSVVQLEIPQIASLPPQWTAVRCAEF